jgi:3-methyladenine DNA glycosylase AlkD
MDRLARLKKTLKEQADRKKAEILKKFFKTGPGEYAEGDIFLGVNVPCLRKIAKEYNRISLSAVTRLLKSKIHEERLTALLILNHRFEKANPRGRKRIYNIYLSHTSYINNWDLVDLTAGHIVGAFLSDKSKKPLYVLARSDLLWERRIAIVATFYFIRKCDFADTLRIAKVLLSDECDLIHKAAGWMLREVGKRDPARLEDFLSRYYKEMPRTMLRYAIERLPDKRRRSYLKGAVNQ